MSHPTAIVGGGIIGLFSALELAHAGQSVILCDKSAAGHEASWAGGGILSPLYPWNYPEAVNRLALSSMPLYRQWVGRWVERGFDDPELIGSGLLILDADEAAPGRQWAVAHAVATESVDQPRFGVLEPGLSNRFGGGLLFPDVGQIRNPRLVRTLRQAVLAAGVPIREYSPVDEVLVEAGRVVGLQVGGERVGAGQSLSRPVVGRRRCLVLKWRPRRSGP